MFQIVKLEIWPNSIKNYALYTAIIHLETYQNNYKWAENFAYDIIHSSIILKFEKCKVT